MGSFHPVMGSFYPRELPLSVGGFGGGLRWSLVIGNLLTVTNLHEAAEM